jgi:hypothetical protein
MDGKVCHIREDNYYRQNWYADTSHYHLYKFLIIFHSREILNGRWILPDPSSMDEHEREEEHRVLASLHPTSSRHIQYAYTVGHVTVLKWAVFAPLAEIALF